MCKNRFSPKSVYSNSISVALFHLPYSEDICVHGYIHIDCVSICVYNTPRLVILATHPFSLFVVRCRDICCVCVCVFALFRFHFIVYAIQNHRPILLTADATHVKYHNKNVNIGCWRAKHQMAQINWLPCMDILSLYWKSKEKKTQPTTEHWVRAVFTSNSRGEPDDKSIQTTKSVFLRFTKHV